MSVRIGLGIANFPFEEPRGFWRWVEQCEAGDVDSIWQTDRLIGAQPFLESMSTMAALAGATERLKFGMNVVVVPFRDPLVLAKECATIDFLSDGRLLPAFGVGGAVAPEFRATSRPMAGRGGLADEALRLMARLWAGEAVTCAGEHYDYRDAVIAVTICAVISPNCSPMQVRGPAPNGKYAQWCCARIRSGANRPGSKTSGFSQNCGCRCVADWKRRMTARRAIRYPSRTSSSMARRVMPYTGGYSRMDSCTTCLA